MKLWQRKKARLVRLGLADGPRRLRLRRNKR